MAGVINEPDVSRLQEYRDAAASVDTSVTPDSEPFGGVFAENPDGAAVSGTASGSSPSSTSTSTAGGSWAHMKSQTCWILLAATAILLAL